MSTSANKGQPSGTVPTEAAASYFAKISSRLQSSRVGEQLPPAVTLRKKLEPDDEEPQQLPPPRNSLLTQVQRVGGTTNVTPQQRSPSQATGGTTTGATTTTTTTTTGRRSSSTTSMIPRGTISATGGSNRTTESRTQSQFSSKLQRIQSQPKNLSPVDATKHPSLLPRATSNVAGKMCLVLDVDETLVHSSYQPVHHYDLHLPLSVNGSICNVYVSFRPYMHDFLREVVKHFEVVVFTASASIYCEPLMDFIDPKRELIHHKLFREHCSSINGTYVKDLALLGRPLDRVCIIDNSPVAYLFQPRNAIPILSWFDDPNDTELLKLIPMLEDMSRAKDVYESLDPYNAGLGPPPNA